MIEDIIVVKGSNLFKTQRSQITEIINHQMMVIVIEIIVTEVLSDAKIESNMVVGLIGTLNPVLTEVPQRIDRVETIRLI